MPQQTLTFDTGPFRVGVRSTDTRFVDTLGFFYRDAVLHGGEFVLDYDIRIDRPRGARRWLRPQTRFFIDGMSPFDPHPAENAFPMFEWGLNWCIATSAHRYLMLHAGIVAFDDRLMILPGTPGSGKSTLAAALHLRGARLMSDEFGLVRPEQGDFIPMPRAIPLKNTSIEAIIDFDPAAPLGPTYPRTRKGRVRHLRPSTDSLRRQERPANPRWLVFPKYEAGVAEDLQPLDSVAAFRQLAFNSFNYRMLGETAFRAAAGIIRSVDAYTLVFSDLERAVSLLQSLTAAAPASRGGAA